MQERRNSIANALELRLTCTNPSNYQTHIYKHQTYIFKHLCQPLFETLIAADISQNGCQDVTWSTLGPSAGTKLAIRGRQDLTKHCGTLLTHWALGDLTKVSDYIISKFQTHFNDKYLKYFLWNCYQVNATTPHWSLVNIGSDNGLVPSGNKPLPEPVVTQICVVIWRH